MKPVDQIVFEDGKGDCLRACVASIIEWPIASVPNFIELPRNTDLTTVVYQWLKHYGFHLIPLMYVDNDTLKRAYVGYREEFVILSGDSPRFDGEGRRKQHAVVGKPNGYGFKIVHDPHPSREGLASAPFMVEWIARPL